MKISYKLTSGMALGALALPIVSIFLPPPSRPFAAPTETGAVTWDPCMLWVQYGPMYKFVGLVFAGAFIYFTLRGLRNRPGPRWLAIAGVLALVSIMAADAWRIAGGCYSTASLICSFTFAGVVGLMFLHHAVQPRTKTVQEQGPVAQDQHRYWRLSRMAYRGTFPALVYIVVVGSILNRIGAATYGWKEPSRTYLAIVTVERYVGWAVAVLLPVGAAMALHWAYHSRRDAVRT